MITKDYIVVSVTQGFLIYAFVGPSEFLENDRLIGLIFVLVDLKGGFF